jgi:hypothetical protein
MSSQDLIPGKQEQPDPASNEVQFALVIARMIETVQNSPDHMRQTVYDLARYKLQEQFTHTEANDIRRSQQALETAIRGVEEFSRQQFSIPAPSPVPQLGDGSTGTAAGDFPPPESSPPAQRSPGRAWIPIEIPLALQKPATRLGRSSRGPRHCWPSSLRSLR